MFGIVYSIIAGLGKLIHNVNLINKDNKTRINAQIQNNWTYVDHNGAIRRTVDEKYLNFHHIDFDHTKDYCAFDSSGKIVRNMTKEIRDEKIEQNKKLAKENGNTVYYDPRGYYVDFNTGIKCCPYGLGLIYFINLDTCEIIRLADCETVTKYQDNNYNYRHKIYENQKKYYDELSQKALNNLKLIPYKDRIKYIVKHGKGSDFTIPYYGKENINDYSV